MLVKKFVLLSLILIIAVASCGKKPRPVLPAPEQFHHAKNLFDRGKYYKAQLEFENLIYTYPGNTVIDTAQFYLSMSYYKREEYGLAAGEFGRLLTAYPSSEFTDDSQYYIAMCHYEMSPKYSLDQSETYRAIDEFNRLLSNYPMSSFVKDSRERIMELEDKLAEKSFKAGELYLKMGNFKSALTYFSFVRDNYPATDWAIRAFFYSGEAQLKMENYEEAKDTFTKFLSGFSGHELAAKAKEKLEEVDAKMKTHEG
jgi:outer membrane protein assembly factor BamD